MIEKLSKFLCHPLDTGGISLSNTPDRLDVMYSGDFIFEATSVEHSSLNIRIDIPMDSSLTHEQVAQIV